MDRIEAIKIVEKFAKRGGSIFICGCTGSMSDKDLFSLANNCRDLMDLADKEAALKEGSK